LQDLDVRSLVIVSDLLKSLRTALAHSKSDDTSDEIRWTTLFLDMWENLANTCRESGLPVTASGLERVAKSLESESRFNTMKQIDGVSAAYFDELTGLHALRLPTPSLGALTASAPMGEAIALRFPEMSTDLSEAAKCLSFGLGTACVFHLMRAMERAVQLLGRKLRVALDVRSATWGQITARVDHALKALPNKTTAQRRKRDELAALSAHLNAVRLAWRNNVMHPKETYTAEEAEAIFRQVRLFLDDLRVKL